MHNKFSKFKLMKKERRLIIVVVERIGLWPKM